MKCWCAMLKVLGGSEERGISDSGSSVQRFPSRIFIFSPNSHEFNSGESTLYASQIIASREVE